MKVPNDLFNFTATSTKVFEILFEGGIFTSVIDDTVWFETFFGTLSQLTK